MIRANSTPADALSRHGGHVGPVLPRVRWICWRPFGGIGLKAVGDLPNVEPVAQKMGERAAGEWDPANRAPGLEGRTLVTIPAREGRPSTG
jgi:hypothetical protein